MPESTTFSQSSTPTPYNGSNSVVTSSDGRWNQVENNNVLQNATPVEWNALPPQNIAPPAAVPVTASSDYHVTSSVSNVNVFNNQLAYNPPNYVNIPYPRNTMPIGYTTLNPTRGINAHIMHGPNVIRMPNGPAIGGSPWPNQAALGRYISQTPAWSSTKTTGGVKKQKRIRTAFTSQQMMELEQEYARTRYLDRARRIELAEILRLNERTIKIWFQNRRMKEKKDRAESLEDSEEASTSESSPEMGHIQIPMAIHEQYPNIKNDVYEQGNVFVEQYPVVSTQVSMPVTSLSTSMPPVYVQAPNMYQNFIPEQECPAQYQQVHLQVQPYPSPYTEAQEMPLEVVPKTEPPTPSSNSNIIEKSWDLSWIKTIEYEEDY